MFDVDWADDGVEKVGERKARKEKAQDSQVGQDGQSSKRGSTTSTRGSSSSAEKSTTTKSTGGKASSLFGSLSLRKNRLSSKSKLNASELRIPAPEANTVTPSLPTTSTFCSTFPSTGFSGENSPDSQLNRDMREPGDTSWERSEDYQILSTRESSVLRANRSVVPIFASPQGGPSADVIANPGAKSVEGLGPGSWITKTTETLIEVESKTGAGCTRSETKIPPERVPADPHTPAHLVSHHGHSTKNLAPNSMYNPSPLSRDGLYTPSRPSGTILTRGTPNASIPRPPGGLIRFRAHNASRWKAPVEWEVEELCSKTKGFDLEEQFSAVDRPGNDSLVDLASVQREIKKMALLVPASILFRLEENSADDPNPSTYKETEMEKKRLMLFALGVLGGPRGIRSSPNKATKILALFETEATASYLAAIHPESSITHISPSPLSALLFPNVRPLVSPILPNAVLSVPSSYFSAVYSLSLPSLLSSQEIPILLRNVHTCLVPGGALHLVLINPAPAASSLGPLMRQWMEDNLLLNLERRFRCTNPRKLIPMWLGEVGLRANDSVKITVKCQAVFQKSENEDNKQKAPKDSPGDDEEYILDLMCGGQGAASRDQQAKLELQSRIGRLLWQETWGSYVNANGWWWDDPHCVEECVRLQTYWEYSVFEAVKHN
ncbi:hypothetical protein CONLIGDRAFT_702076 [Coniochaeta ligniaria NRRL 30616]|uniref:Uncharacterized protein n=1 Tax=Coniochaeta ligniaria NRRL 30616 TaxID=1408157 RepID=A0A1J7IQT9_9PEZI|nr:hypothetical protein CONLIGDRAFT_702076 [Coniochaeta ligniaria NRRL 30616]